LFDEGRTLLQAGKIAEACAAFESSQKLDPAVTTLLNLADCREQNHQLATAWGTFVDANRAARASNNDKFARVAAHHARKLEPRLSKLTIAVSADRQVSGLEILRNGELVNPASWNHALPIDGGTYTITARAPGRAPWSITRKIKIESDAQTVDIPKLTEVKPGAPVAVSRSGRPGDGPPVTGLPAGNTASTSSIPTPGPTPGPATPGGTPSSPAAASSHGPGGGTPARAAPPAPSSRAVADAAPEPATATATSSAVDQPESSQGHRLPLAVGAGALVLGGAALGLHLWGNDKYEQASNEMMDQARRDELEHAANTRRYLAQGVGVAAIGCAGAAVYLYLRSRGEGRAHATAMAPVASPQFAGLAIAGRW
jgi:hypothetical protein